MTKMTPKHASMFRTRQNKKASRTVPKSVPVETKTDDVAEEVIEDVDVIEKKNVNGHLDTAEDEPQMSLLGGDEHEDHVEIQNVIEKLSIASRPVRHAEHNASIKIGEVDLTKLSYASLIEIALKCTEAAEQQRRELLERQKKVADRMQSIVRSLGNGMPGAHEGRSRATPKIVYRDPESNRLWRGIGTKPRWLRDLEADEDFDIKSIQEPYDAAIHDAN